MARIGINDKGLAAATNGDLLPFFSLQDDGDEAVVRFMYEEENGDDLDYYLVHEVQIDGRRRYVACTAYDTETQELHEEDCPLCLAKNFRKEKLFLKLYLVEEDRVVVWERGKSFIKKVIKMLNEINCPPCGVETIIRRNGEAGDRYTSYELYPGVDDGTELEDLPETDDLEGTLILLLNDEDMVLAAEEKLSLEEETPKPKRREATKRKPTSRRGREEDEDEAEEAPKRRKAEPRSKAKERPSGPSRGAKRPTSRPSRSRGRTDNF